MATSEGMVAIEYAEELRSRRVVSRSNYRVTGKYPGFKSQRMHYWESHLERDAFLLLDYSSDVLSFSEQPALIRYGDQLESIHYPDLLLTTSTGREFVEVKTDEEAMSNEVQGRTQYLKNALPHAGYSYRVWKESEIRKNPMLLNNIRYLFRFGRKPMSLQSYEWVRKVFSTTASATWLTLVDYPSDQRKLSVVCRMVIDRVLQINLELPITPESVVKMGDQS